jgi:hypothetical protein
MRRSLVWTVLLFAALAMAIFIPRLPELDRYVTPDEPKWLMRSGNFYMALSQGSLKDTYQHEHPGVTITWAGMLSFLRNYPSYVEIRPGQIERPEKLFIFLRNHVISPLRLLETGRQVVVVLIGLTLLLGSLVAWRLLGLAGAITGFLLIALDPFYVALSRLLHVDGLMSALMLLSILAFCAYMERGRNIFYLLLSAAAAGLSWLTKSPAFFLIPFLGLARLAYPFLFRLEQTGESDENHSNWPGRAWIWSAITTMIVWGVAAGLVFVLFWPAMWVDPLGTLGHVFSQATAYAVEGHENATFFNGQIHAVGESAWYFYPVSYLWRATPFTLAGVLLALIGLFAPRRMGMQPVPRRVILILIAFAVLFTIFMSLGAKKFDRYLLPVHITLDLAAGIGWAAGITALIGRYTAGKPARRNWIATGALGLVVGLQLLGVLRTYPYYFNYYNPLLGGERAALEVMMVGWGEGLDRAAAYLNSLPNAENLEVVAWYGDGPLSYLFDGRTISMDVNDKMEFLEKADYVVLYLNQWQRQLPSPEVLDSFDRRKPDFTARIGDLEYARVYRMNESKPP